MSVIVVSWQFYRKQNAGHPKVRQKQKASDFILLTSQTFLSYSLLSVFRNHVFPWQGKLPVGSSWLVLTLSLTNCVTLDKLLHTFGPQFCYLET